MDDISIATAVGDDDDGNDDVFKEVLLGKIGKFNIVSNWNY